MKKKINWKDWVWVILGSLLVVRTGNVVWKLHKAGERVTEAKIELAEANKTNRELKAKLEEVNSPEFIEREAREKLGYGREGEVILLLPEQSDRDQGSKIRDQGEKSNWRKWWELYIRL